MNDFGARFSITDSMTPVLRRINEAMQLMNDNMARANAATKVGLDDSAYRKVFEITQDINKELDYFEEQQRRIAGAQDNVTRSFKNSEAAAEGLGSKLGSALTAYAAFQAASKVGEISDSTTAISARLGLISDGQTAGLQSDIFKAAQSSRGNYMDMQSVVAKLGLMAGDKFDSNAEMVRFVELLNKNFIVGGAGSGEQSAAMYQLTQAMASGALQGDEFRSVRENAPLLAQAIEDYMRNVEGATGSMKDWSAEGLLTADVIKNAMFYAADEVEARFEQMPMTISQIGTVAYNSIIEKAQPTLEVVNDIANFTYKHWDKISLVATPAAIAVGTYASAVGVAKAADAAHSVWQGIKNTLTIRGTQYTKEEAAAMLKSAAAEKMSASAKASLAVAAGTASVGQRVLNAAMYACPIFAIIGAVGTLIGLFVDYGDSASEAAGETNAVTAELDKFDKKIAGLENTNNIELDIGLKLSDIDGYTNAKLAQAEWKHLQELMSKPLTATPTTDVNEQLKVMNYYLEDIKDKVPGLDAATVAFDGMYASIKGINGEMTSLIENYATLAKTQAYIDVYTDKFKNALSIEIDADEALREAVNLMESATPKTLGGQSWAWDQLLTQAENLQFGGAILTEEFMKSHEPYLGNFTYDGAWQLIQSYLTEKGREDSSIYNYEDLMKWYNADYLNAISGYNTAIEAYSNAVLNRENALWKLDDKLYEFAGLVSGTGNEGVNPLLSGIADDTSTISKNVVATKEDLKYLRDIAERETINRFTTAEVKINLGGITQTVNNESDLDGIVTYLTDHLTEQLLIAADGVHA